MLGIMIKTLPTLSPSATASTSQYVSLYVHIQCKYICVCVFSDVYVFGVGEQVKKDQLNSLASKKRNEKHVFVLKDFKTLGDMFNSIISK